MMRESEEEEAVHAYSVTAHVLHKGMENLQNISCKFGIVLIIELSFLALLLCTEFAIYVPSYPCVYAMLSCVTLCKCNTP